MLKKLIAFLLVLIALPVSAAPYKPSQGGTGISTTPTYGQLLVGAGNGVYTLMSTSTLGIVGAGTVTSVDMSVPTGLTIAGNPITTAGTLALSLTPGYVIPTIASTSEWAAAYLWGDHSLVGYLTQAAADLLYQPIGNYLNKDTDTYVVTETDPVWESEKSGYLTSITNLFDQWLDSTSTPIFAGLRLTGLADPAGSFIAVDPDGDLIATTTPSGGGGTWGTITGTLSDQTDLQNALDDKAGLDTDNTFSLHNIFTSLFATNASSTNATTTNFSITGALDLFGTWYSSFNSLVDGILANLKSRQLAIPGYIQASILEAHSATSTDGYDYSIEGFDTGGYHDWLVYSLNKSTGVSNSFATWNLMTPPTFDPNADLKLTITFRSNATSSVDFPLQASICAHANNDVVESATDCYDTANAATSTVSGTPGQIRTATWTLTNKDGLSSSTPFTLKLFMNGSTTPALKENSNLFYIRQPIILSW